MAEAEDRAVRGGNAAEDTGTGRRTGGRRKASAASVRTQTDERSESVSPRRQKRRGSPAEESAKAETASDKNNTDTEKETKTLPPKDSDSSAPAAAESAALRSAAAADGAELKKRGRGRPRGSRKNDNKNITDNKSISANTAAALYNGSDKDTENKNITVSMSAGTASEADIRDDGIKNDTDNKKTSVKGGRARKKDSKNVTDIQNSTEMSASSPVSSADEAEQGELRRKRGRGGRRKAVVTAASQIASDGTETATEERPAEGTPPETAVNAVNTKTRGRKRRKPQQVRRDEEAHNTAADDSNDSSESSAVLLPESTEQDLIVSTDSTDAEGDETDAAAETAAELSYTAPNKQRRGRKRGGRKGGRARFKDEESAAAADEDEVSAQQTTADAAEPYNEAETAEAESETSQPSEDIYESSEESTASDAADNISAEDNNTETDAKTDIDELWLSLGSGDSAMGPSIGQFISEAGFSASDLLPMPPRRRSRSGKRGRKRGFKGTDLDIDRIMRSLARHPVKVNNPPVQEASPQPEQPHDTRESEVPAVVSAAETAAAEPVPAAAAEQDTHEPEVSSVPTVSEATPAESVSVMLPEESPHTDTPAAVSNNPWSVLKKPAESDVKSSGRSYYRPASFSTVDIMSSLKGFAPMGMLFVLMDILDGHEEGLIHVNQLAQALAIGKPSLLAQLDNLESAGLIRTILSSRAGRHIELLTPNLLKGGLRSVFPDGISGNLTLPAVNVHETGGQFSMKQLEFLYSHLKNCGIEVVSVPDETSLPPEVSQTAAFLGKYLQYVQPFYNMMKTTLNDCREFRFSLANSGSRAVTHTLNFCRLLKAAGFLSSYTYRKSPQYSIIARVKRLPDALNFISGGWLEHYIRDRVVSVLTTHPVTLSMPYAFLKNPKVILPGGEDFELDFLLCVGRKIFWMEAKTGEYLNFLQKYSRVKTLLGLTRATAMLVSVEPFAQDSAISVQYGLSCCTIDEFQDVFRINLVRELQQSTSETAVRI